MSELEAVFFDLYDTLVWSDWADQAASLAERVQVSPELVAAAYEDLRLQRDGGYFSDAESVMAAVLEHCGVEPKRSLVADLAVWEAGMLAERIVLYDDSIPVLRQLREAGVVTGVISNCSPSTRPVVDRLGLEDEVDVVLLSCEVGVAKPDQAIFGRALQAVGVDASRSLFVDDRSDYLDGAAAMGMETVQIARDEAVERSTHPRVETLQSLLDRLP